MSGTTIRFLTRLAACLTLAIALGQTGCTQRRADFSFEQPHAPPSQRRLTLESDWAFTAAQDARRLVLIDFALPGAADGPRDFRVFLVMPGDAEKSTIAAAGAGGAAGFFIQKVGRLSGKTVFVEGTVAIEADWLRPGARVLSLDARCADGTRVAGRAQLRESDEELRMFLEHHAADVAALDAAERPQTALAGDTTPSRSAQAGEQHTPPADSQPSEVDSAGTE